jgi:hypothetical protein
VKAGVRTLPVKETDWVVAGAATFTFRLAFFGLGVAAVGLNVTLTVQLAPMARLAPQVVVRANWLAFVPASAMPLMVIGAVPELVTVTTWGAVMVLSDELKVSAVGVTELTGETPVPLSETVCGVVGTELAIEIVADLAPIAVGLNLTLIVQLLPAARVVPQVVVRMKSAGFVPAKVIAIPVRGMLPALDIVTVLIALVVPTS